MIDANPRYTCEVANNKAARDAADFDRTFEPQAGVEYEWVTKHSREQYDDAKKVFDGLDAKATAIITYLSSRTGLITLGSIAAIATEKVPAEVVWCSIPALVCSCIAIVFALRARRPLPVYPPSGADKVVGIANHYKSAKNAEAAFLSHWHLLTVLLRPTIYIKSWNVDYATRLIVATVALLFLPLFVALLVPKKPDEPKPLSVIVQSQQSTPSPTTK